MTNQARPISRLWRRFLRFSVRGLLMIVLLVGAWLGCVVRSARIQREAVAAIEKARGWVEYDWKGKITDGGHGAPDWVPKKMVDALGVDYFGNVIRVSFSFSSASDI